jgi:molecular chaperone Hsp33
MTDSLERSIALSGKVFGVACDTTQLVAEACRRHDAGPTGAAALGRALTGALLLAAILKDNQSVQLKFEGNGPLGKIITEAGYSGWARGYLGSPKADIPLKNGRIDVASGIGKAGFLTVTKTINRGKKYSGTVQLYTSEIAEDIAFYLAESEQIPSVVSIGVHLEKDGTVKAAGGFLLQTLPPADEDIITELETQVKNIGPITSLLASGKKPGDILSSLLSEIPHKSTSQKDLVFQCSCSHEKMRAVLSTLKYDDILYLLEQPEETFVQCEFCQEKYVFEDTDLEQLKKEKDPKVQ